MTTSLAHSLPPGGGAIQRKRVLFWHDAIIDLLLANPEMKQKDIAAKLNRTENTISLVVNSDVFRRRYAARRAEHAARLSEDVVLNNTRVANKALELTLTRLNGEDVARIPVLSLFSIAEKSMERLGYGVKQQAAPIGVSVQTHIHAPADAIANARADILRREQAARTTVTVEVTQPPAPPSESSPIIDLDAIHE